MAIGNNSASKEIIEKLEIVEIKNHIRLLGNVKKLLEEYGKYMYVELGFTAGKKSFYKELQNITTNGFQSPWETFIVAVINQAVVGCVGIKKFSDDECEMKRMYITPAFRGKSIGQHLCNFVIEWGRQSIYNRLLLDTNLEMKEAVNLYKRMGFKEIKPYCVNENNNPIFMEYLLK